MKLSLWTRYHDLGASSRLRFLQFIPFLQRAGWDVELSCFLDNAYLQALYAGKKRPLSGIIRSYLRRWKQMKTLAPGVPAVIEYELLPYLPFFMEKGFLKQHPFILNFDDAVDLRYEKLPLLKNKYPQLLRAAAGIITANDLLSEKFAPFNRNIFKLPTIPPAVISPGMEKAHRLTLVWTGTPVTYKFLYERREALRIASENTDFELLIVGGCPEQPLPGVNCRFIPWSEANEADAISQAHAGIMPLPDTPFARGKSAYKLLCYLRGGIPGIASPVGENCRVIRHNGNGFLADSDTQWAKAVSQLNDRQNYARLASEALKDGQNYLPEKAAEQLNGFLNRTFTPSSY